MENLFLWPRDVLLTFKKKAYFNSYKINIIMNYNRKNR